MSDSRLEKFIYAICSMDVSDLPVPLSRIEKLWNCLITGETPDFEPLSRNEKYLMAMLDRYDISNLPSPISRGEKLLYKIAVGETDLSDVPGYLSRYEELLKYLIENGGISGGDFEYVLHTLNQSLSILYQTVEKPVKSAILKGQTLVNIDSYYDRNDFYIYGADSIDEDGYIQLTAKGTWVNAHTRNNSLVKPNTKYAIIVDIKENTLDSSMSNALKICTNTDTLDSVWSDGYGIDIAGGVTGRLFFTATTSNNVSSAKMLQRAYVGNSLKTGHIKYRWMIIEYQQGMENWDIPYFTGMQSVKMPVLTTTGKNLFNGGIVQGTVSTDNGVTITTDSAIRSDDYIELIGGETYTISKTKGTKTIAIVIYDENKKFVRPVWDKTFTLNTNEKYIKFADSENDLTNLYQIEKGVNSSSYEPYKSNILTVNEDVELRGIADMKDELDCLTCELTERIGEFVLNGDNSISWSKSKWELDNHVRFDTKSFSNIMKLNSNSSAYMLCDKFRVVTRDFVVNNVEERDKESCNYNSSKDFSITISKNKLETPGVDGFKKWLSQNSVTIQLQLETESIKTVDLTTVDQDGQPTKLKTFNDISYVEINADNIIPSVDVEVATKISETLATLDPQQNDISDTQNKLGQTINEQSENTDATMMATTEIYEQTL